ncbi:MAG: DUF2935 domain-containing protein [Bacillota bacterium]|jgi:hypothetical protein
MRPCADYVRQSIDTHLFFGRIMKEHSFFLQAGFVCKDTDFIREADTLRKNFDHLLRDVVSVADGVASPAVLQSGEVVAPYTCDEEAASSYLTGIRIPTEITRAELGLRSGDACRPNPKLERTVDAINRRAIGLTSRLIDLKVRILSNVLSCRMFTVNYPLLIDHILREARLYLFIVETLQAGGCPDLAQSIFEQEQFWNRIMGEHAKFIRGLLDPTEEALFDRADELGNEFDRLLFDAVSAIDMTTTRSDLTEESLTATLEIREFKRQGAEGLLACQIRSIIIPLLGDHVLREANHYLPLLQMFRGCREYW